MSETRELSAEEKRDEETGNYRHRMNHNKDDRPLHYDVRFKPGDKVYLVAHYNDMDIWENNGGVKRDTVYTIRRVIEKEDTDSNINQYVTLEEFPDSVHFYFRMFDYENNFQMPWWSKKQETKVLRKRTLFFTSVADHLIIRPKIISAVGLHIYIPEPRDSKSSEDRMWNMLGFSSPTYTVTAYKHEIEKHHPDLMEHHTDEGNGLISFRIYTRTVQEIKGENGTPEFYPVQDFHPEEVGIGELYVSGGCGCCGQIFFNRKSDPNAPNPHIGSMSPFVPAGTKIVLSRPWHNGMNWQLVRLKDGWVADKEYTVKHTRVEYGFDNNVYVENFDHVKKCSIATTGFEVIK